MTEYFDELEPETAYELRMRVRGCELARAIRADGVADIVNHPEWPEYPAAIDEARLLAEALPKLDSIGKGRVEVTVRFSPDSLSRYFDRVQHLPPDLKERAFSEELVESREEVFDFLRRAFAWEDAQIAAQKTEKDVQLEQAMAGASPEQIATAIPGYLDGDDIVQLIHLLRAEMSEPA